MGWESCGNKRIPSQGKTRFLTDIRTSEWWNYISTNGKQSLNYLICLSMPLFKVLGFRGRSYHVFSQSDVAIAEKRQVLTWNRILVDLKENLSCGLICVFEGHDGNRDMILRKEILLEAWDSQVNDIECASWDSPLEAWECFYTLHSPTCAHRIWSKRLFVGWIIRVPTLLRLHTLSINCLVSSLSEYFERDFSPTNKSELLIALRKNRLGAFSTLIQRYLALNLLDH